MGMIFKTRTEDLLFEIFDYDELVTKMESLRAVLDSCFCEATCHGVFDPQLPSKGHCAVVALYIHKHYGGDLLSRRVHSISHWYNRLLTTTGWVDVSLTDDQFSDNPVIVCDSLYIKPYLRYLHEVSDETLKRAELFEERVKSALRDIDA